MDWRMVCLLDMVLLGTFDCISCAHIYMLNFHFNDFAPLLHFIAMYADDMQIIESQDVQDTLLIMMVLHLQLICKNILTHV